ncbi:MAG: Ig domain-containing protein, partial [Clostridia bacterium]|nr:Ig domain-containing protein [Clostridia bacterium]
AKAVCRDVDEATDIEYGFVGESVKENIIIKEKCDEYEYTFKVNSHGLTAKLSEDKKEIGFYADESAEDVKFKIPAPFMFDAKGDTSTDVHYELKENGEGEYTFKVIAAAEWINRDATTLPVTVDPTVYSGFSSFLTYSSYCVDTPNVPYNEYGWIYAGSYMGDIYRTNFTINKSVITQELSIAGNVASMTLNLQLVEPINSYSQITVGSDIMSLNAGQYEIAIDITDAYNLGISNTIMTSIGGTRYDNCYVMAFGVNDYSYSPYITAEYSIPVNSISVSPTNMEIYVGSSQRITATVSPDEATNKDVIWHSNYPNIASVSSSGLVTGKSHGNATIFATSADNSIIQASCSVSVRNINVQSLSLSHEKVLLKKNESFTLIPTITPSNATNKTLYWETDRGDTFGSVHIDEENGTVTAIEDGVVTITVTTQDGGFSETCTVEIDSRDRANVVREQIGDTVYFNIVFEDGKVWKSIGCDMSLPENQSDIIEGMRNPKYQHLLYEHERRFLYNSSQRFTEKQLAFIYLLDPLGVEYVVKNYYLNSQYDDDSENDDWELVDWLTFKDNIYKAIFNPREDQFYFTYVNGHINYVHPYNVTNRENVYSCAEVLFGKHNILSWDNLWETIFSLVLEGIFGEVINAIETTIEVYQAMFHSGSFVGTANGVAATFARNYLEDNYMDESLGSVLESACSFMYGWPGTLLQVLNAVKEDVIDSFIVPNINDLTIYDAVNNLDDYRVSFGVGNNVIPINEIIALCSANNN